MSTEYWDKKVIFYDKVDGQLVMGIHTHYEEEHRSEDVTHYYLVRPDDTLVETWFDL